MTEATALAERERRAAVERQALVNASTIALNDIYVRLETLAREHISEAQIKLVGMEYLRLHSTTERSCTFKDKRRCLLD